MSKKLLEELIEAKRGAYEASKEEATALLIPVIINDLAIAIRKVLSEEPLMEYDVRREYVVKVPIAKPLPPGMGFSLKDAVMNISSHLRIHKVDYVKQREAAKQREVWISFSLME